MDEDVKKQITDNYILAKQDLDDLIENAWTDSNGNLVITHAAAETLLKSARERLLAIYDDVQYNFF